MTPTSFGATVVRIVERLVMTQFGRVWATDVDRLCDGAHRSPLSDEVEHNRRLLTLSPGNKASRGGSFSIASLPSNRFSSSARAPNAAIRRQRQFLTKYRG